MQANQNSRIRFLASCFGLLIVLLTFLLMGEFLPNFADAATSTVTAKVNAVDYFLNLTTDDVDIELNATVDGAFANGTSEVRVSTNSATGYKVYLSMNNNNANGNRLYKTAGSTIDTTNYLEATTEQSNLPDLNSWGYSTNFNIITKTGTWKPVPLSASPALVAENVIANPTAEIIAGTEIVDYGVYANAAVPGGEYSGTVLYTAIADAVSASWTNYVVNGDKKYVLNAGDTITIETSLITTETLSNSDVNVTVGGTKCNITSLDQSKGFLTVNCSAPNKSAGTYSIIVAIDKFNKNYSITGLIYASDFWKITNMQQMTNSICSSIYAPSNATGNSVTIVRDADTYYTNVTAAGQPYVPERTLTDTRDNQTYIIRKLADGNCWMTQNMNYELKTTVTLTASNSNVAANWTPSRATASGFTPSLTDPASYNLGDKSSGILYNYAAATAGNFEYNVTKLINYSICPKGWTLPKRTDFQNLVSTVYGIPSSSAGITTLKDLPISAVLQGYMQYDRTSPYGVGSSGNLWTSESPGNVEEVYSFRMTTYNWRISSSNQGANWGHAMRCLAQ